ncbi:antioxidant, AhpC/TSA family [Brevibacterium mcbrellneri ATCC 49030]|uniref:Antioxidant, AhpC/TSA family n=1 Tax=Brevibacterium mcbrellneri ATCC 49030 TaxID=585530 RepID=D4YQ09_9MICO|nr:peroxiredoxin [Brevibacterium mcbrellneri]EFG46704.1 antioxidant, AhpC/TSA family [Brevibacterium mcbrellneri ATCC 49030]
MTLMLGDVAPDFTTETSAGEISFHDWVGDSWVVFFSHPADFTPVCTTELGRVAQLSEEWAKRGVKPIALSVDSNEEHISWIPDINSYNNTTVEYPIIADPDKTVAELYDMIHPNEGDTSSVRSVFVIDPFKKIRLTMTYPKSTGRNFDEILRVIDALQTADRAEVATPVDWKDGDKIIVPTGITTAEARERFDDVEEAFPYLRTARIREN